MSEPKNTIYRTASGRQRSFFARAFRRGHEFWNRNVVIMFVRVFVTLFVLYIALLSIYWGTYYKRNDRLHRLKFLGVVLDDVPVNEVEPVIGNTFKEIVLSKEIAWQGTWTIVGQDNFTDIMKPKNNNTILEEFERQIFQQYYWAGCLIVPNASYDYSQAIQGNSYINSTMAIQCLYQTGRDLQTTSFYITPVIEQVNRILVAQASEKIIQPILNSLDSSTIGKALTNITTSGLLTNPFIVDSTDLRPVTSGVFAGIIYAGLIYIIVITIQLFNFSSMIHAKIESKIHKKSYILYRIGTSQVVFFYLSLAFSLAVVAFQLPYDAAFGKSGFLVILAATFLNFSALGAINEIFLVNIVAYDRSKMGFYIVAFIIVNMSGIMSALAVCPKFYRYSYALIPYNLQRILVVCFFDTTKKDLGRNFAILVAWVVVTNALVPLATKLSYYNAKRFAKLRAD